MDDNSWIFAKLPNWLRWVLALPIGILTSILLPVLSAISCNLAGVPTDNILYFGVTQIISVMGLLAGLFLCVPKHKAKISGVASILFAIYYVVVITMYAMKGAFFIIDNLVYAIVACVCIYIAVKALMLSNEIDSNDDNNVSF